MEDDVFAKDDSVASRNRHKDRCPCEGACLVVFDEWIAHTHSQFDSVLYLIHSTDANSALFNGTTYVNATRMNVSVKC